MYGTLEPIGKVSMGNGLVQGTKRQKQVTYTEGIYTHYKFWQAVDDHNEERHFPISLEVYGRRNGGQIEYSHSSCQSWK
jgi:hypothetical protein